VNSHTKTVKCVTANNDSILSGSLDGTIRVWNGTKSKVIREHGSAHVNCLSYIHPTGYSFSCDSQGRIKLLSSDGSCQYTIETNHSVYTVALIYIQDTLKCVALGSDGKYTVWKQISSLEFVKEYEKDIDYNVSTMGTHVSPDCSLIFLYGKDGTVPVYAFNETNTGDELYSFLFSTDPPTNIDDLKHSDKITSLQTNPARYWFVCGIGKYAFIYDLESKLYCATITRENDICTAVCWLNYDTLVLGYESGTVVIHSVVLFD
jgi:WD40 repeat protein